MDEEQIGITEKLLLLKDQLVPYLDIAAKISDEIKRENISRYPIIVVHQDEIDIGIPVVKAIENENIWSVNASTLEQFYTNKLIKEEKLEEFRSLYKSHADDLCFFVLSELGGQFLFLQRV
ncbi:MAG: hypothetical protein ACM3PT_04375 [Deltaproteobacteria bacterium]